jgi:GNAT superfamily N-acetyltransferase
MSAGQDCEQTGGGVFYGWRRGWPLPALPRRPAAASAAREPVTIEQAVPPAALVGVTDAEIARRLTDGHVPFVARVGGEVVAFGWSATTRAHIGGVDLTLALAPDERYLWDFATHPEHRGRGLYPLLLQAILRRQEAEADWFWIGHDAANGASRRGILKAGFREAGHLALRPDGGLALAAAPAAPRELAARGARVLGLPLVGAA